VLLESVWLLCSGTAQRYKSLGFASAKDSPALIDDVRPMEFPYFIGREFRDSARRFLEIGNSVVRRFVIAVRLIYPSGDREDRDSLAESQIDYGKG
jgi:hypothetical protein